MFKNLKKVSRIAPLFAAMVLAGCGDGADGAPGAPGTPGIPGENSPYTVFTAAELTASIAEASIVDGKLTFSFSAEDQNGTPLVGITGLRVNVIKLVADDNGDAYNWTSFLRKSTDIDPTNYPDVGNVSLATNERDGDADENGELVDNLDGTYQYTFANDVLNAVDPVSGEAIAWEEDLTHRIGLEIRNSDNYPVANITFDWVPSGAADVVTRNIVTVESCNECHTEMAFHGGNRIDTDNCVTCHNPDTTDPISGESLDLKVMVHKLHHGIDLPTLANEGNKYSIFTKSGNKEKIFAENDGIWVLNNKGTTDGINYPQDIRNCTNCHADDADLDLNADLAAVVTTDGGNWKTNPTIETCASCHDDIAFNEVMLTVKPDSQQHFTFPVENGTCLTCHGENSSASVENVHTVNAIGKKNAGIDYGVKFEVESLVATTPTAYDVHVRVTKDGTGITLDDEFLQYKNSVRLILNWDNGEGFETHVAKNTPNSFELDNNEQCRVGATTGDIICNWDTALDIYINGGEQLTSGNILASFISSSICVDSDNTLVNCEDNNALEKISTPSTVVNNFFDAASLVINPDFELKFGANFDKCGTCHEAVIQHDSRRSDDPTQCKACHNANRFARSPADSPREGGISDLKFEIHKTHSNYLFIDAENNFDMVGRHEFYPAPISDCSQCHDADQIDLPLAQNSRPSITRTPDTNADEELNGKKLGNSLDNTGAKFTSPIAAVCSSCHLSVGPGLIGADGKVRLDGFGATLLTKDLSSNGIGYDNNEFPQVPVTITAAEQQLLSHMVQNGAQFNAETEAAATGTESCATCHAIGSVTAVDTVHGMFNK